MASERAVQDAVRELGQAQWACGVLKANKHPALKRKMGLGQGTDYSAQVMNAEKYLCDSAFALSITISFIERGPLGWLRRLQMQRYVKKVDGEVVRRSSGQPEPKPALRVNVSDKVLRYPRRDKQDHIPAP